MKTWLEISKKNILHNFNEFARVLGKDVNIMAVVKSNAYGHGLSEIAEILSSYLTHPALPLQKGGDDAARRGISKKNCLKFAAGFKIAPWELLIK